MKSDLPTDVGHGNAYVYRYGAGSAILPHSTVQSIQTLSSMLIRCIRSGDAKSYAERLFEFPEIGPLPRRDTEAALLVPAHDEGIDIAPDALTRLVDKSGGYPYFIQEWGKHAWNQAADNVITLDDVAAAEPVVVAALDRDFFRVRFDRLT
ncbi:MAG: hypothetical protein M3094_08790, partial [Actinomycetia bacterium]|nr:hypothetical protein [Actinomycetes bacterium]